jgi:hypothetical protein
VAGVAGYAASAKIGANIILEMNEWSADIERAIEEDTEFGDAWESGVATVGKGAGSIKGNWDMTGTQQAALQTACLNGTTVSLRLYTDSTHYYSGSAYITKVSPGATVKGLVTVDVSFQFTGTVSYT